MQININFIINYLSLNFDLDEYESAYILNKQYDYFDFLIKQALKEYNLTK